MAPIRRENANVNSAPLPMLIILTSFKTYWQHIHIHTHTRTYTLNTGSVIQSVKSISCVSWWEQTRRRRRLKVSMTVMAAAVCRGQIGSDTVKRSMSSGYCSPSPAPRPPRHDHTLWLLDVGREGGKKVDDNNLSVRLWSKDACPVHQQDNISSPPGRIQKP